MLHAGQRTRLLTLALTYDMAHTMVRAYMACGMCTERASCVHGMCACLRGVCVVCAWPLCMACIYGTSHRLYRAGAGTSATSTGITTTMRTTHCATCAPTRMSRGRIGRSSATRTAGTLRARYSRYTTVGCAMQCAQKCPRCVSDTDTYGPSDLGGRCSGHGGPYPPLGLHDFSCTNMGISSGCSDVYASNLDCQWIDITGIPNGNYWLTVSGK